MNSSPWGKIQHQESFARGVLWVSSAGHGGLLVAKGFAAKYLSEAARAEGLDWFGYLAFEEDICYAVAAIELPHLWPAFFRHAPAGQDHYRYLLERLSLYYPNYLRKRGIHPISDLEAKYWDRQLSAELRAEKHPDLIVSASRVDGRPDAVHVWSADGKEHLVRRDSYHPDHGLNLLSKCVALEA